MTWRFSINNCDEKFSFAPISFKLGSAYVSDDLRISIKKIDFIFLESSEIQFDLYICSREQNRSNKNFCSKIFKLIFVKNNSLLLIYSVDNGPGDQNVL